MPRQFGYSFIVLSLFCLFSLTLQLTDNWHTFKEIYEHIFHLPVLKYSKISSKQSHSYMHVSLTIESGRISSIDRLIINHQYNIDELLNLLSHTPRLGYMTSKFLKAPSRHTKYASIDLPNFRYISITNCDVSFEQFELFYGSIQSPIEALRFKTTGNMNYVNANKWKRLITHMSQLQKFYFQCAITFHQLQSVRDHKSNEFISLFWIERQWIFKLKIDVKQDHPIDMTYIIHPYRKPRYEYAKDNDDSSRFTDQNLEQSMLTARQQEVNDSSFTICRTSFDRYLFC